MRAIKYQSLPRVKGCCRLCGATITDKYRTSTCSAACAERVKMLCFPSQQRHAVWRRDHGVCRQCGMDTDKFKRIFHRLDYAAKQWLRVALGLPLHRIVSFWDMDHMLPVEQGGGVRPDMTVEQVLANLQTLCWWCHKAKTAAHAAERARRRRSGSP